MVIREHCLSTENCLASGSVYWVILTLYLADWGSNIFTFFDIWNVSDLAGRGNKEVK